MIKIEINKDTTTLSLNGDGRELLVEALILVHMASNVAYRLGEEEHREFMMLLGAHFDFLFSKDDGAVIKECSCSDLS